MQGPAGFLHPSAGPFHLAAAGCRCSPHQAELRELGGGESSLVDREPHGGDLDQLGAVIAPRSGHFGANGRGIQTDADGTTEV